MIDALLLSGGIESICLAFWLKPKYAFTIDYGQLAAEAEIKVSAYICKKIGISHIVVRANCSEIGSGDLAGQRELSIAPASDWWPFRNQLIITLASARAVKFGVEKLYVGSVSNDQYHKDAHYRFYELIDKFTGVAL